MKYLLTLLAFLAAPVLAAPVVLATGQMPTEVVKLYAEPCSNGVVLAQLDPAKRKLWRNGDAQVNEKDQPPVPLCWIKVDESPIGPIVYVVAENGAHGPFPVSAFDNVVK